MKRGLFTALLLGIVRTGLAQSPPALDAPAEQGAAATPENWVFSLGQIDFGAQLTDTDTNSSKFREYRDVRNGVVFPYFRLFGQNSEMRFDLSAENIGQGDGRYRLMTELEPVRVKVDYNLIKHRFGNDARTLLHEAAQDRLVIDDTIQRANQTAIETQFGASKAGVNYPFLLGLVTPELAAANRLDLALLRQRGLIEMSLTPGQPVDVKLSYFQERRTGNRAAGTSFGFGNVVESPEPINYRTEDWGASAEYARSWGLVRGAVHYNTFNNANDTLTFDNPFRVTDSTDASAYTGPASGSIAGPSRGRIDLSADNKAVTASLGFILRLPANSRFTADFSGSRWTQNRPFMPYTINSAIGTASNPASPFKADDPANLPARSLDGKIDIGSLSLAFTSRPMPNLGFSARLRIYDLSNKTQQIDFPGYVRFDAVWEAIPRVNVPYGYKRTQGDATVSYDFGPVTVEGGYRYLQWDRTFRETNQTRENTVIGALNLHALGWALLRASYEKGWRDRGAYDYTRSEDASFQEPAPAPTNLPSLRRFDQARRDLDRFNGLLQLTPGGGDVTVSLSYWSAKEDYNREAVVDASGLRYGLLNVKYESFTAEADYSPGERWSVYGFYTRENNKNFQRGRQSGAAPSTSVLDDWTADVKDKSDSFGIGANALLVPDKLDARVFARYQKVDGNNNLMSPPGGAPDVGFATANFDDTRIWTVSAELTYHLAASWNLALGGWLEEYRVTDSATTGLTNYVPGSFFLAANDGNYKARVGYLRASYHW
jgi:MtrB/PioB family decaheme-associated outer membrane protein